MPNISSRYGLTLQAVTRDTEIQAEDEQSFLAKQLALLQQGGAPIIRTESPMRTPAGVQKTGDRRVQGSPSVQSQLGSPKKVSNIFSKENRKPSLCC